MLFEKMCAVSTKFPLGEMDRKEGTKLLRKEGYPSWVARQSDLPTYVLIEESKALGYKQQELEELRQKNGSIQVTFDGRYWICNAVMTEEYTSTEAGAQCLEDFRLMSENGNPYLNTSNTSSERRHCVALAKAASVMYKLAFIESKDVESVEPKRLQNKERRVEIYKFGNKMSEPKVEEGEEQKAEAPTKKKGKDKTTKGATETKKPWVDPTVTPTESDETITE